MSSAFSARLQHVTNNKLKLVKKESKNKKKTCPTTRMKNYTKKKRASKGLDDAGVQSPSDAVPGTMEVSSQLACRPPSVKTTRTAVILSPQKEPAGKLLGTKKTLKKLGTSKEVSTSLNFYISML